MITRAEFQSTETVTIDQGSSVNVGLLVEPKDLTQEDINNISYILGYEQLISSKIRFSVVSITQGLMQLRVTNVGIPDGETITGRLSINYPYGYTVVTKNNKSFMGGMTG